MTQTQHHRLIGYLIVLIRWGYLPLTPGAYVLCEPVAIHD